MNINKLLSLITLIIMAVPTTASAIALSQGATVHFSTLKYYQNINTEFTISIVLDPKALQVTEASLALSYDQAALQPVSFTANSLMSSVVSGPTYEGGIASISLGSGGSPITTTGEIAKVTFRLIKANPGDASAVRFKTTKITALGYSENVTGLYDGPNTVYVFYDSSGPTATVSVAPGATPTPSSLVAVTPASTFTPVPSEAVVSPLRKVSRVSTGPFTSTLAALIVALLSSLLYLGYTTTNAYRRGEVGEIVRSDAETSPDFNETTTPQ